jgi:hypothetical protein
MIKIPKPIVLIVGEIIKFVFVSMAKDHRVA